MTTELIIVRSLERGLTLKDFEDMTVGMLLDVIITFNNLHLEDDEKEEITREATQSDMDNF